MEPQRRMRHPQRTVLICLLAAVSIETTLFLCHVRGSGWHTFHHRRQSRTMRIVYDLGRAFLEYKIERGSFPSEPSMQENVRELLRYRAEFFAKPRLPIRDDWGQLLGYTSDGSQFLLWSTGYQGGDAGPDPDWLPTLDSAAPEYYSSSGVPIFDGYDPATLEYDLILRDGTWVQWPLVTSARWKEGPRDIGDFLGTHLYTLSSGLFPQQEVLTAEP